MAAKNRTLIPRSLRRQLLLEAGYRCSIPYCREDSALEFHHIDSDPANHHPDNLLVVCSNHHRACTVGRIDRKACKLLRSQLKPRKILSPASLTDLKRIIREELRTPFRRTKVREHVIPSAFNRQYLIDALQPPIRDEFEAYCAIRILGELRYRGSANAIVSGLEHILKRYPTGFSREYSRWFLAGVDALSGIRTRAALDWLADQIATPKQNDFFRILILSVLESCPNAPRFVGFAALGRTTTKKRGGTTTNRSYRVRGRTWNFSISVRKVRGS